MPRVKSARRRAIKLLTPSEHAVIGLVAAGLSNAEIALRRGVSVSTICNQLTAAYRKLRVTSRRELHAVWTPSSTERSPDSNQWFGLSPREREILALVETGHSNKVIAPAVGVSISTVSTLLTRARRKLASTAPPPATAAEGENEQQRNGRARSR